MSNKKNKNNKHVPAKKSTDTKNNKGKYSAKRKIPLSLLLAFTAPLTVFFFGPFETYCGNMKEFLFSLGDFLPYCIGYGAVAAVAIFAVLMLLNGRAYDIAVGVVVWLSVMTFVQRYYLNFDVNALAGDGVGNAETEVATVVLTTLVWVVVGAAVIFASIWLKKKNIAPFFVASAVVLIVVLATQTVGFAARSLTTDVYVPVNERVEDEAESGSDGESESESESESEKKQPTTVNKGVLTYENLNELSNKNNVIFFLIDRFDVRYFENLQKTDPEFLESLGGFTFYNDYTSLYCRTYPAVASIITGKENDFEGTRLNYFKEIYGDGGHLRAMNDAGYTVNLYTEQYYVYDDAFQMIDYVDNVSGTNGYYIDDKTELAKDMIRLSLNTCLPFPLKDAVGELSTPKFNSHVVNNVDEPTYDADNKNVYEYITEHDFVKNNSDGQFSFIHIYGCHTPVKHNLNWEKANDKEKNDTTMALKQSLTIVYEYIEQMKKLGVYDDATIVITGDHPAALSDSKLIGEASKSDNGTRVTAMLFKRAGETGAELKTSTAQISQDELWNTIYESEGLMSLKTGDSFFDIAEGEERVRRYLFERSVTLEDGKTRADEIVEYKITGTARDRENWEIEKVTVIGKIYK